MNVCLDKEELLNALKKLEIAEGNGFVNSLAVIKIYSGGETIEDFRGRYDSVILKAHPVNPSQNWGRTNYPEWYTFVDGQCVAID